MAEGPLPLTKPTWPRWGERLSNLVAIPAIARCLKSRALIAYLIYLGPILRGWERLKWRLKESRVKEPDELSATLQKGRVDWFNRALHLSYWTETWEEKELLLGGLMSFLAPQKYFIVTDQGWSDWDLKIARGLWSRAYVTVVAEDHGGGKRLFRVRCAMRLSRFSVFILRVFAVATALLLIVGALAPAVVVGVGGLAFTGFVIRRVANFGGLMHRIVETVAKHAGLIPVTAANSPRKD